MILSCFLTTMLQVEPDSVVVNFYRPLDRDFVATTDPLHVTFMLERSCFIRQHAAIEAVNGEVFRKILFPTQLDRDESLPVNHDSQGILLRNSSDFRRPKL